MCELAGGFLVGADQYMSQNFVVPGAGKVTMTFTPADGGREQSYDLFDFQVRDSRPSQLRPPLRMCCALDIFFFTASSVKVQPLVLPHDGTRNAVFAPAGAGTRSLA